MPRAGAFRAESPPNGALRTSGGRLATEETLRGSQVVAVAARGTTTVGTDKVTLVGPKH